MDMVMILLTVALFVRAATKICDKYLIQNFGYDADIYAVFTRIYSLLFVLVLLPFIRIDFSVSTFTLIALFAGAFKFLSLIFFFGCLKRSDVAMSVGLKQSFGLLFPFFILGTINPSFVSATVIALASLSLAASLVMRNRILERYLGIGRLPFLYLLISCGFEFAYVSILGIYSNQSYLWLFCWSRIGAFCAAVLLLSHNRRYSRLLFALKKGRVRTNLMIACNEILSVAGKLGVVYLIAATNSHMLANAKYAIPVLVVILLSVIGLTNKRLYHKVGTSSFLEKRYAYSGICIATILVMLIR